MTGVGSNKHATLFSEADLFGTIIFANEAFCKVSGYNLGELIGKPHSIIRHADMPKKLFESLWTTIKKGEVFRGVIKNLAKDSSSYWVNTTIMPIFDDNKGVYKYIGVYHLIEDIKLAQELYVQQANKQFLNLK